MAKKNPTFAETLTAAARLVPGLTDDDERPNLTAIARHCTRRGHPVSQPTLQRHFKPHATKPRALGDEVAQALEAVFRVPARIWKGETVTDREARALSDFHYETILLAQKIESLPKKDRDALLTQIENALSNHEELQRLLASGNVTSIDRGRR